MAAPFVLFGTLNNAGSDRIKVDVGGEFFQVLVGLDQDRLVPPLEQVARFSVPPIEPLSISQSYALHDSGKRGLCNLNLQMDVVCHEAEGVDFKRELLEGFI